MPRPPNARLLHRHASCLHCQTPTVASIIAHLFSADSLLTDGMPACGRRKDGSEQDAVGAGVQVCVISVDLSGATAGAQLPQMLARRERRRTANADGVRREHMPRSLSAIAHSPELCPHPVTGGWPSAFGSEDANGDAMGGRQPP